MRLFNDSSLWLNNYFYPNNVIIQLAGEVLDFIPE
jgi:hypothetical protein